MPVRFTFQQSTIWEGAGDRPDPTMPRVTVKVPKDDESRARQKLPRADLGRAWLLVKKS